MSFLAVDSHALAAGLTVVAAWACLARTRHWTAHLPMGACLCAAVASAGLAWIIPDPGPDGIESLSSWSVLPVACSLLSLGFAVAGWGQAPRLVMAVLLVQGGLLTTLGTMSLAGGDPDRFALLSLGNAILLAACAGLSASGAIRPPGSAGNRDCDHRFHLVAIAAVLVTAVLAGGWLLAATLGGLAESRERAELEMRTRVLATAFDSAAIATLSGTPADLADPGWQRLHRSLTAIRDRMPGSRYCYLMRRRPDGKVIFLVDAGDPSSHGYSPPGELYDEAQDQPETLDALTRDVANTAGPVTDRWGTWLTSNAAVVGQNGQVVALFGIDLPAGQAVARWHAQRMLGFAMAGAVLLAVAAAITAVWRERTAAVQLARRVRLEQAVADACRALLAEPDPQVCLEQQLPAIGVAAGVERVRLVRFSDSDAALPVRTWRSRPIGDEVSDRIDYRAVRRWFGEGSSGLLLGRDEIGKSGVAATVPVPVDERPWGALVVESSDPGKTWDEGELAALRALGSALGAALTRHGVELQLRQAKDAAERTAEAKADFLATMSHEFRTPLGGILGMNALLLESRLDPGQREQVRTVQSCADGLLKLVDDILDFSKIEAGRMEIAHQPFDPRELVEDALAAMVPRALEKNIELACAVSAAVPARTVGDPGRLRQVLLNLLGNAVKFTDRGEVVVRLDCSGQVAGGGMLELTVVDSGSGIPPELLSRLFVPFSQAQPAGARVGGNGLGLAISKRLVELMGGVIALDSQPGQGTTVRCSARVGIAEAPPSFRLAAPGTGDRALVVETNQKVAAILADQFSALGLNASICTDIEQAVGLCRSTPPRVVVLSSSLPERPAAAARSIGRACLPHKPLILLTVPMGRGPAADELSAGGIAAVLQRPVRPSRLARILSGDGDHDPPATWTAPSAVPSAGGRLAGRVLVVEDNAVNCRLLATLLGRAGLQVDTAGNGVEAVAASARAAYDCILMDVEMPEMDGMTAARLIRSREAAAGPVVRVPIVAVTANAFSHDRDRALAAGMDDHLRKPVEPELLIATVRRLIEARRTSAGTGRLAAKDRSASQVLHDDSSGSGTGRTEKPNTRHFGGLPLDTDALDRIEAHLGKDGLAQLLEDFESRVQPDFDELRAALADNDVEAVRQVAHRLGSGAGSLGLVRLMAALRAVEKSARAGDTLLGAGERIDNELERGRAALREHRLRLLAG